MKYPADSPARLWLVHPEFCEKLLQQSLTLHLKHSSQHFDAMVQAGFACEVEHRPASAGFGISRAENQIGNACENDGTQTHGTGFECHVECRVGQPPAA